MKFELTDNKSDSIIGLTDCLKPEAEKYSVRSYVLTSLWNRSKNFD
jgi:hypothetical protein